MRLLLIALLALVVPVYAEEPETIDSDALALEGAPQAGSWSVFSYAPEGHGTVTPDGMFAYPAGSNVTYTFTPDQGYVVAEVQVDTISVGKPGSYTFTNISADHILYVKFALPAAVTYTITSSYGTGGGVTPTAVVAVGASKTFAITPIIGYAISDVLVDGVSVGPVSSYKFSNVHADHTIHATFAEGEVNGWGYNTHGEMGNLKTASVKAPAPALAVSNVSAISAGYSHTVALKDDGTVMTWGLNSSGQLGRVTATSTAAKTPDLVPGVSGVTAVSAGKSHTLALLSNGTVMSWGLNSSGQLGRVTATSTAAKTPAVIPGLTGVTAISAGASHSLALLSDGTVVSWGSNSSGQLGRVTTSATAKVPTVIPAFDGALSISAANKQSFALKAP